MFCRTNGVFGAYVQGERRPVAGEWAPDVVYWDGWKGACVGVIDAIAEGCFAVARRPVLLLPLVALDLLYWLGARLTAAPLLEATIAGAAYGGPLDERTIASLRELGGESNLFTLLALGFEALLPALAPASVARPWAQGVLDPGSWPLALLSALGLALAGLLWLALYLCGVAQLARGEPFDPRRIARRAPVCWLRLLGLGALVAGGLVLLGLPLLLLTGLLVAVNVNPALPLLLALAPLAPLYCLLALAPEAIAVSEVGPLRAIKLSVGLVRRNFLPTIALLAATFLLTRGFRAGWSLVTGEVAAVPLAIAGNAFLAAGLSAAAMLFYRERLAAREGAERGA
jgi:hypothetical protein